MKKVLSLILILVFLFSLIGCSNKPKEIKTIVDKRDEGGAFFVITEFYRDDKFSYTFSDSNMNVIVYYKNGTHENAVQALKKGRITIDDFDTFNIGYDKERLYSFEIIDDSFKYELKQKTQNFYMDEEYVYYFPEEKLQYIRVEYPSGLVEGLTEALKREHISISDLDSNAIPYCRKPIADIDASEYADLKYDDSEYDDKDFFEKIKVQPKNEVTDEYEEDEEQEKEYDFSDCTVTFKDGVLTFFGKGEMKPDDRYKINTVNQVELVEVVIKEGITNIPNVIFARCKNLRKITIPNTVKKIGKYAFSGCENLDNVKIPDSVTEIGEWAFNRCERLESIVIPDSVVSIERGALTGCESLKNITLSDRLIKGVDQYLFYGTALYNDKTNWENGVLYVGNHLIAVDENVSGDLKIKEGTVSIGESAFVYREKINSLTIPKSVVYIHKEAFWESGIKNIIVDENNKYYSSEDGKLYDKNKTKLIIWVNCDFV